MGKRLIQKLALSFFLVSLIGCNVANYKGVYKGYPIEVNQNRGLYSYVHIYRNGKEEGKISFTDEDNDNRFDNIKLDNIPKGDPMEQFANLDTADEILNQLGISFCDKESP